MPILRAAGTLILGLIGWVGLGYLATVPLGAIFGWSGHPAIPDAPTAVYVIVYLVLLPALCFSGAWKFSGWMAMNRRGTRHDDEQGPP